MTVKDPVYLQIYARAPAPCRDYYGLTVSETHVILNIWNISHGPHVYPKRQKSTLEEFAESKYLQNEIKRIFGAHVLDFVANLISNQRNLQYLPTKVFLRILRCLSSNDILHLSQTSKMFFEICSSEAVWKIIFRKRMKKVFFSDADMADKVGWKEALKTKIFAKKVELNNKNLHAGVVKRPEVIKNVKTAKSASLIKKVPNVPETGQKLVKNVSLVNVKAEPQNKCLKLPINRSQVTQRKVTFKAGDVTNDLKSNLGRKAPPVIKKSNSVHKKLK